MCPKYVLLLPNSYESLMLMPAWFKTSRSSPYGYGRATADGPELEARSDNNGEHVKGVLFLTMDTRLPTRGSRDQPTVMGVMAEPTLHRTLTGLVVEHGRIHRSPSEVQRTVQQGPPELAGSNWTKGGIIKY